MGYPRELGLFRINLQFSEVTSVEGGNDVFVVDCSLVLFRGIHSVGQF